MILETGMLAIAIGFGVLGIVLSRFCYKTFRQHRELIEFLANQNDELQESLSASKDQIETASKRLSDQSRRIAWLETRVRQPKTLKKEIAENPVINNLPKSNITERRHRVLTLASRGQDLNKIASTLGMMPGEVELIINLNRVAV